MASAKTVEKTMDILELISKYPDGLTLTEIYKALDLPKVTVYDILKRLYAQEALYYRDYHLKKYAIGPKMFSIGQAFANNTNFIAPEKHSLNEYANKHNMTIFASTRMNDLVVYTYKCEGSDARLSTKGIGVQMPITECPDGKCYLAFEDDKTNEELSNEILNSYFKGKANQEYETLMKVILSSREKGFLFDNGITESFVFAIAFPIFNFENKMVGVISACRIMDAATNDQIDLEISELEEISKRISHYLGYGITK
ncbi:MAG: helix-turn-helix domain-containing protein [Bacilli bacterium]|nr:helix-turn-helix domain-containing protein [Bacilli bacterium]